MIPVEITDLKRQIKALKSEKGIASKAVGIAKKDGSSAASEIQLVSEISNKIKDKEAALKALTSQEKPDYKPEINPSLPPQFLPRLLKENSSELKVINNLADSRWEGYVNQHPNATVYHSLAIRQVIETTFGHHYHALAAIDDQNQVQGVLPLVEMNSRLFGHFFISLPFFNYGGLLSDSPQAQLALLDQAKQLARSSGVSHIEFRHTSADQADLPGREEKVAMLRSLPKSSEALWEEIGTKVRAQIKKAQRQNTCVSVGRENLIDDFYRVFSRNMRDLGTPVYRKDLFSNMLKENEKANIVVVYLNNKPVSAGFLLGWRNTLEIPWASTLREANRFDCNMLLYWEVLKFAVDQSYEIFDFGRSSKDASTFKFKKQWGAKPYPLYWHHWVPNGQDLPQVNPNNPKYRLLISVWKKLPVKLAEFIGPMVVKNIP